ncbi:MAG: hypothetical protein Q9174_000152 [Haloplaca sp. 1 TL-2023]
MSSNIETAENMIDQVISMARDVKGKPDAYPAEELEWIVTSTFNRAVDFYCALQDDMCRKWAEQAITLAELVEDDGHLHQLLQNKFMGLTWDGR